MKKIATGFLALITFTTQTYAQNVGIGTTNPTSKLMVYSNDPNGKGIIQTSGTAEIGFYTTGGTAIVQTYTPHPLHFATGNSSPSMTLNGNNFGIGTTTPTARLDVNGSFRLRSADATNGAILKSADANGNVVWQRPYAFRVTGLANGENQSITLYQWNKVFFNTTASHNIGLSYQPLAAQFVAPVNGIYHFNVHLKVPGLSYQTGLALNIIRSGNEFTAASDFKGDNRDSHDATTKTVQVTTDIQLFAGDIVYVLYWGFVGIEHGTGTWFSGHLITQL